MLVAEEDRVADAEVLDEVELLVDRRHADGDRRARLPHRQRLAVDEDLALGRRHRARHALDQRRLAGAVGTEQAVDLAGANVEVDARERAHARVLLDEAANLEQRPLGAHDAAPTGAATSTQRSSCEDAMHGLDDLRGAQAVAEHRHAVARRLAADRRRRRRRRTGRSSPRSPAGARPGAWPGARRRATCARGRGAAAWRPRGGRPTASPAPPGRRPAPPRPRRTRATGGSCGRPRSG